ncbi:5-formyltetrahydrofolate cyclo-ligase [Halanaerobacter jeridensis]|uniref:5-formyltetrahydrofolate cyclo-ligase n=1 Tax=Halanaerobacter jeridensis TaxID=706427 RepID=A0A938XRB1_9FIRM|nr:5-formyltetrahydrofolate cyclo-ligase [Halanaerobacter jeridensis]MBM7556289.1 5-formyltetrahydrofolate cyclo-ligase [Halanaerobacter jeridensis]
MTKEEQREKLLEIRNNLSTTEVKEKSKLIKKRLFATEEYNTAQTILIYISFNNEVRTKAIIKKLLAEDKRVIVPITDTEEKRLYLSELKNFEQELTPSSTYGILEPKPEYRRLINKEELDLIIAPGVGFDDSCNRIGYGGGYYDRLLASDPQVLTIALAFSEQLAEQIKTSCHDQKVEKIITDKKIISCK